MKKIKIPNIALDPIPVLNQAILLHLLEVLLKGDIESIKKGIRKAEVGIEMIEEEESIGPVTIENIEGEVALGIKNKNIMIKEKKKTEKMKKIRNLAKRDKLKSKIDHLFAFIN